jgi:peptide/nickel transport system permease protein
VLRYIGTRVLIAIPLLFILSMVSFIVIQVPPGDYLTLHIQSLRHSGQGVDEAEIERLVYLYGLDRPMVGQYWRWITNILLRGDFGQSMGWNKPVAEVITERLALTAAVSLATVVFIWVIAVPIGILSAIRQYSIWDYVFTFLGFIGLATPSFALALIIMWVAYSKFGINVMGLFSVKYALAPWSIGKVFDLLSRLWVPMLVIGLGGTARIIRVMRATLLDELKKQYVVTARAKGLSRRQVIFRYPVRVAINPLVSTIGWELPGIVSGEMLVSIVLNLPTSGPVFLKAILQQDMYLAGSFVLILSALTILGTLVSDIFLAWLDPRIRYR